MTRSLFHGGSRSVKFRITTKIMKNDESSRLPVSTKVFRRAGNNFYYVNINSICYSIIPAIGVIIFPFIIEPHFFKLPFTWILLGGGITLTALPWLLCTFLYIDTKKKEMEISKGILRWFSIRIPISRVNRIERWGDPEFNGRVSLGGIRVKMWYLKSGKSEAISLGAMLNRTADVFEQELFRIQAALSSRS